MSRKFKPFRVKAGGINLLTIYSRIKITSTCWLWTGHVDKAGYGKQHGTGAHRIVYMMMHGSIPDAMTVDHMCFNTLCVNPLHLQLLTRSDNSRKQRDAIKKFCVNGHEYTYENTYLKPNTKGEGKRDCRACIRGRVAKYQASKKLTKVPLDNQDKESL